MRDRSQSLLAAVPSPDAGRASGFTLIELVMVITIISVLAAIALPQYKVTIIEAKEAVLKEDLFRMRDLIDQYWADKGRYPESVQKLVEDGYLRHVPADPMTRAADWQEIPADPDPDDPSAPPGIIDVKSASQDVSLSGTAYSEW
jgi:general secretion pathway protein G